MTRSFYILHMCCSFLDIYVHIKTYSMSSNEPLSWSWSCYYHIFTISHNHHIHSPNVDVIQSQNAYFKSVSFFKRLFFNCHTNPQFSKIHTINAHYSTNGVITINYYYNLVTHTLNAHCPRTIDNDWLKMSFPY